MSDQYPTIKCLDHGFVSLVDHMGDDLRVVQAAKLSYKTADKPSVRDMTSLINYLMEHAHSSPFEMVVFTFHMKMPIFVARQHIRHRTARLNELSGRYSEMPEECYVPALDRLRVQSTSNKQGSGEALIEDAENWLEIFELTQKELFQEYHAMLKTGMAKELARINLPLSTYTEMYWQMDLHNLLRYLKLRIDPHAQEEIRVFAQAMYDLIVPIVPITLEAFKNHELQSVKFSGEEMRVLAKFVNRQRTSGAGALNVILREEEIMWSERKQQDFLKKMGVNW